MSHDVMSVDAYRCISLTAYSVGSASGIASQPAASGVYDDVTLTSCVTLAIKLSSGAMRTLRRQLKCL